MNVLRRTLYLHAALWGLAGAALALAPRTVLVTVLRQPAPAEDAWLRIAGVQAFTISMIMVMVAHRVEELWWWSWAFALSAAALTAVVVLNAAFGRRPADSPVFWWVFSAAAVALAASLLYGLFVSSREQPLP